MKGGVPLTMEFRKLNQEESKEIEKIFNLTGGTCTGASYVKDTKTYYIGFAPLHQATPSLREKLARALGTTNLVINGRVKVEGL